MSRITLSMQCIAATLLALFLVQHSQTEEQATSSERAAAQRFLASTNSIAASDQVLDQIFDTYAKTFKGLSPKQWQALREEFDTSELAPVVETIHMKHFTAAELDALSDFFDSPIGKKYIEAQPMIIQESMEAGAAWAESINERLISELKSRNVDTRL